MKIIAFELAVKLAAGCLVAASSLSAVSARKDTMLWLPEKNAGIEVEYKGNDPVALKVSQILSSSAPDDYFTDIRLIEKKTKGIPCESYTIKADSTSKTITVTSPSGKGLLYGGLSLYRPESCRDRNDAPVHDLRILNHWDNLDRTVERGYAGKSIWNWREDIKEEQKCLYEKYALANAMAGINGTVLNNVNASPEMLTPEILKNVAKVADIFRPYGIRVYLSVNFASPMVIGGVPTADPLSKEVERWWKKKTDEIYSLIPDFGGFLVKANSEGQPGPCDFGRTHAEGANMLAKALKTHGGIVMWRAFVYSPSDPDRAKQAYAEFEPLDGTFADNVMVQVKNGPVDFQPREPYSALFAGMENTPLIAELQITQEYLGHANHVVYLGSMWKEFFNEVPRRQIKGVAGVANIGDNENFTGNPMAQSNWYAFGRLAWNPDLSNKEILDEWTAMTPWLSLSPRQRKSFGDMMESSRQHVVDYMMPMGLHHLFAFGHHYGPEPWCDVEGARADWLPKYYHKADINGIGFDRTSATGSGATSQYPDPLKSQLEDVGRCPEKYLLWFHHVGWDDVLPSGVTVWEALNRHYDSGVDGVAEMRKTWRNLKSAVEPEIYEDIERRLLTQHKDAIWWRDACLEYFGNIAGKNPEKVSMHKLEDMKKVNLEIDNYTNPSQELLDQKR